MRGAWRRALLLLLLSNQWLCSFGANLDREIPPPDYFAGKYDLIGRKPDSRITYSGTAELKPGSGGNFILIRRIDGREIRGTAIIQHASPPADHPLVLRICFVDNGHAFDGTLLWRSDFDNYPRLTGFISESGKTKRAGLEAWFAVRQMR